MPYEVENTKDMEQIKEKKARFALNGLSMRIIFRCMMENGYYPTFEKDHILFDIDDNIGVVEYEEGVLSIRIFFTIEEDAYGLFLEASNSAMIDSVIVKPIILDDMKSLMFSCETLCDTVKEFNKFLPRMLEHIRESVVIHKEKMKKLVLSQEVHGNSLQTLEENFELNSGNSRKLLS